MFNIKGNDYRLVVAVRYDKQIMFIRFVGTHAEIRPDRCIGDMTMELKPIKTKRDYQTTLRRAQQLWDAPTGSADADALDILTLLIADYEANHFPIADPDPIQYLEYVMESRGLTRKDLEPFLGSRARVAEMLNRARPLTLEMIRRLSERLGLPADILVQRYPLRDAA